MNMEALSELARTRAQQDEKALKKVIRDFFRLISLDVSEEELLAAHETFKLGLNQTVLHASKTVKLQQVTDLEVQGYQNEAKAIEQTQLETRQKLVALKYRLTEANEERARRIGYDAIAKSIGKLPTREKGESAKSKLVEDIALLREEQKTYAATWNSRMSSFDSIVGSLEEMGEAIRDEKAEQERRRALDEDDNEEVSAAQTHALDPNATVFEPSELLSQGEASVKDQRAENGHTGKSAVTAEMEGIELEEGQEPESKEEGEMELA